MTLAQRIRMLRNHGFSHEVIAAILNVPIADVAQNALNPAYPAG